ncbi:SDR family NAD(P)-dependent oxidoreductase, partial [Vibrio parahaemolyticus]
MSDLYLVTGASSGIGLSICRNLLFSGHRVVGIARTEKAGIQELLSEYSDSFYFCSRNLAEDIDSLS